MVVEGQMEEVEEEEGHHRIRQVFHDVQANKGHARNLN